MTDRRAPRAPRQAYQGLPADRELPFVCLGPDCRKNCCGPFAGTGSLQAVITSADLGTALDDDAQDRKLREDLSIFAQIRLTREDVVRLQDAGLDRYIVRRRRGESYDYYLQLNPDGSCLALGAHGMCTIYSARPTICRAFPFQIDMFTGLSMVSECPGVNAGWSSLERLRDYIDAAVAIYKFWADEIRPDSEASSEERKS